MMDKPPPPTLGSRLRTSRLDREIGLRELARQLDIAPSYLADIENDRRTPTEHLLASLSQILGLDFDDLMALSGRIGEDATRYAREVPAAARFFRRMAERNLDEEQIRKLEKSLDSED